MEDFRAKTLREAFRLCDVDPLLGAGLERYYVDLSPVRKTEAIEGVSTVLDFKPSISKSSSAIATAKRAPTVSWVYWKKPKKITFKPNSI